MRAELKGLDTSESSDMTLSAFRPRDSEHFALDVNATVGIAGQTGAELFTFQVCSPSWLASQTYPKGFTFERNLLVERWNADLVQRAIGDLCRRAEGDSWKEIAEQLSRYSRWEFEDYRE